MSNTSRLFFALWPTPETRQTLAALSQTIAAKDCAWVSPHNLHLTLVFLGAADAETIKQAVAGMTAPPFALTFDRLSYWQKPRILCLTCQQPAPNEALILTNALEKAAANCGLRTDTRPYTPHITLARHADYLPEAKIEPLIWRAESFCLVESCSEADGVRYQVIAQWPLTNASANPDQSL